MYIFIFSKLINVVGRRTMKQGQMSALKAKARGDKTQVKEQRDPPPTEATAEVGKRVPKWPKHQRGRKKAKEGQYRGPLPKVLTRYRTLVARLRVDPGIL